MEYIKQKRLVKTFYIMIILFLPVLSHLGYIQLFRGEDYRQKALDQHTLKVALEDIPRGRILDANGRSLTGNQEENRVLVFPDIIQDKQAAARELGYILGQDKEGMMAMLRSHPGVLPFRLTEEQVKAVEGMHVLGVLVRKMDFRYGTSPLASHVVGYLGRISDRNQLDRLNDLGGKKYSISDLVGQSGLEYFYEKQLKAEEVAKTARAYVDVYHNLISGLGIKVESNREADRQDVVTTLDGNIQREVEKVMDQRVHRGAVVVMDARTGDLVAMASRPNFNPTNVAVSLADDHDSLLDHCTALYQPGSIFKIVVAAAALEEGLVKPNDTFVCLGEKDHLVRCWKKQGHGPISFEEAFSQSCNPVFAELGLKLGAKKIMAYARALGLEDQSIIGYPVPKDKRQNMSLIGQPFSLVNSSIGQGPVLATPVQLTAMMNVIVNNGVYIQPRLVKELKQENGEVIRQYPLGGSRKVISCDTAKELRHLLGLVTTIGVGKDGWVPVYGSAGKTGSAETSNGSSTVNAWFSGFAPEDKPKYVITVLVEEGISGGTSAAPVFREIMENILPPVR